MASSDHKPFPFKIIPLDDETQQRFPRTSEDIPNGFASCNHFGFKLSATVTPEELDDLYNQPLDARDTWVVTPPKCGTTWTLEMVWLIVNNLDFEGAKTLLRPARWIFLDFDALTDKEVRRKLVPAEAGNPGKNASFSRTGDRRRPSPRFVSSHLPMSMNNPGLLDVCKVVYVARNPKDVCVSFFHHQRLSKMMDFTGDLELFVDYFMKDQVAESPFIDHMIEAWNLRHHPNMCFLFYEDMKRDLPSQIRKVAKFFGKTYSDEQVERLAAHLHIDNFKKNPYVNNERLKESGFMHADRGSFIRKGKTGDWKNHFTPEMNAKFDKWMAQKLRETDLRFVQELSKQD
ncbi:sulfotransferase 1C4-like [Pollicipes pollicipes]|uniref:sulfotransferase 1C4-like n=1 Tax=Pollicipes pollicipes TaxID=41117 RepID=UPI0018857BEF|nr:sulfotransferase 1C4-like [Pollicipes pollicipes]